VKSQPSDQAPQRNISEIPVAKPSEGQAGIANEEQGTKSNERQTACPNDEQAEDAKEAQCANVAGGQTKNVNEGYAADVVGKETENPNQGQANNSNEVQGAQKMPQYSHTNLDLSKFHFHFET
jgi:hypothetical protein